MLFTLSFIVLNMQVLLNSEEIPKLSEATEQGLTREELDGEGFDKSCRICLLEGVLQEH